MKNEIGFINKKYIQPDYYNKCFSNWSGIYIIDDTEYHVQSISDPYDINNEFIVKFEVLKQNQDGRSSLKNCEYTSLKDAVKVIEYLINNHEQVKH